MNSNFATCSTCGTVHADIPGALACEQLHIDLYEVGLTEERSASASPRRGLLARILAPRSPRPRVVAR